MCALVVHDYEQGAPVWESGAPGPSCGDAPPPGVAVVRVVAAGLNFFDVLMCRGKYQYRPAVPFVPGVEFAGVVEHVGAGSPIPVGARVFGSLPKAGAYARRIAVPLQYLLPIPETLTFDEAAAFGMVYATSHFALIDRGDLREGCRVLVLGAAGGIGLASVQIAKAYGATVIGVVDGDSKREAVLRAGADAVVNYRTDRDWPKSAWRHLEEQGADLIVDTVGGSATTQAMKCIAWNGRLLVVGFTSGSIPSMPLNLPLLKQSSIVGVFWGAAIQKDRRVYARTFNRLFALLDEGKIRPVVSERFPVQQIGLALQRLMSRETVGKIVLTFEPNSNL
ncbi:Enoyl reductase (ER) domain-containing protein [Plasmodiophora brassicae]|uniref:Enoyl reductase (ER) domain-containing protein n=1 Tax=Plasmodiophora brassicae TaxID=37360 RepID=A0A0G4IYC9_PLABS|nr:hypothetical protein PBRA_007805 [Plasmodiophora brassicae]SPR00191.1 unnamed protein product [Plasmodiophora brassicae]